MDYSIFYRRSIGPEKIESELAPCDVFVSAFNSSDRVNGVFGKINSRRKIWLVHPEYAYAPVELPANGEIVTPEHSDERLQVETLLGVIGELAGLDLCIDITGFMRHVLAFLIPKLALSGVKSFTALYSEPAAYVNQEGTQFSTTTTGTVRPVRGMGGSNHSTAADFVVMSVGFDHKLISEVCNHKDSLIVYPLFAFPSLSPDMYQQSAIRASQGGDVAQEDRWIANRRFAPANDPFSTASIVSDIVSEIERRGSANIYLAPLSTKVQTLGIALYWHLEGRHHPAISVLLPECATYSRETSAGLKRLWAYTVELDL